MAIAAKDAMVKCESTKFDERYSGDLNVPES